MSKDNKENNIETEPTYHMVVYCDGSAVPNPGFYGTGLHGYIYSDISLNTKSGDRPGKFFITDMGYIENGQMGDKAKTVIPLTYIDGYRSNNGISSNNVGEIDGIQIAIEEALNNPKYKISSIYIKTDSRYAMGVFEKAKGPVTVWDTPGRPNIEKYWLAKDVLEKAKEADLHINIVKVLGHSTAIGNHLADRMAFLGRDLSTKYSKDETVIEYTDSKYWKPKIVKNHLINFKNLFFMKGLGNPNLYTIINYGTDVELGKKTNSATFGLVKLHEPIEYINSVIDKFNSYLGSKSVISTIDLKVLYSQRMLHYYKLFKDEILIPSPRGRKYLSVLEEDIVCSEVYPPGLAKSALDKTLILNNIIYDYEHEKNMFHYVDITDKIYGLDDKGKVKTILNQTDTILDVPIDCGVIKLEVGIDIIDRNALKNLEKEETKVYLVYTYKSETSVQYWSLVNATKTNDVGVYCNFYTDYLFCKK